MASSKEICWPFLKPGLWPVVGLNVKGPKGIEPEKGEAMIRVDTGYDGFLLVDEETYYRLGMTLAELPRSKWADGETVTGETVRLRRAIIQISIPRLRINLQGYAETFHRNKDRLAGLKLLGTLNVLLDGPSKECCVI